MHSMYCKVIYENKYLLGISTSSSVVRADAVTERCVRREARFARMTAKQ